MVFFNETGTLGVVLVAITNNITGSLFLTVLFLTFIIVALFAAFRVPIEVTALMIMPFLLVAMAYQSEFIAFGGVALIYMAVIFVKNFFLA